jgi:hypothetical protein
LHEFFNLGRQGMPHLKYELSPSASQACYRDGRNRGVVRCVTFVSHDRLLQVSFSTCESPPRFCC